MTVNNVFPYYRGSEYMAGRPGAIIDERDLGELEQDVADSHFSILDEKFSLIAIKEMIRNREVNSSHIKHPFFF